MIACHKHVIDGQSPVLYIDLVPSASDKHHSDSLPDVIVVHRDGTVRRLSGNLKELRWIAASVFEPDDSPLPAQVLFAQWVSYADASTGLLRKREDILKECAPSDSSFLVTVSRDGHQQESRHRVSVFHMSRNLPARFSATSSHQLRLVATNPISDSRLINPAANIHIDFHAPTSRLSISSGNELINYDLSAYAPSISFKLAFGDGHSSLFPLTATLAAGAMPSAVQIYDMDYQSIQARYQLTTKARRRGHEDNGRGAIRFVSYFAKISTLVAVRGRNLTTFQVMRTRPRKEGSRPGGLLIDFLGHSTYQNATVTCQTGAELGPGFSKALFVPNQLEKAGWEAQQKKLDQVLEEQGIEDFERMMAAELQDMAAEEKDELENSPVKLPSTGQFVSYDKTHYLLSKMFRACADISGIRNDKKEIGLVISLKSPRLLQWLAQHTHLTESEVERALAIQPSQAHLKLGAVAHAIMDQDTPLSLLTDYLEGSNVSGLDEAIIIVKMLIKHAVSMAEKEPPSEQLLIEDSQKMAVDERLTNGTHDSPSDDQATLAPGGWRSEYVAVMSRTLETLYGFAPAKIASAMRAHLDTEDFLALIQFLRQQLFRSGHTSSFPSFPGASDGALLSLHIIVSVLSSCIDALGPLGFLGPTFDEGLWQDLVPDLKIEVSLALAGIEEATYLKGVLQEMVRYGNATTNTQFIPSDSSMKRVGKADGRLGAIMRVYNEPAEEYGHYVRESSSLMPLSLTMENAVSKTKKRKGGGEVFERSDRELQYLESRNIGRYSFERLIL